MHLYCTQQYDGDMTLSEPFSRVSITSTCSSSGGAVSSQVTGPSPSSSGAGPLVDSQHSVWSNPRSIWAAQPSSQCEGSGPSEPSPPPDSQQLPLPGMAGMLGEDGEASSSGLVPTSCHVTSATDALQAASLVTLALFLPGSNTFVLYAPVGPSGPGSLVSAINGLHEAVCMAWVSWHGWPCQLVALCINLICILEPVSFSLREGRQLCLHWVVGGLVKSPSSCGCSTPFTSTAGP